MKRFFIICMMIVLSCILAGCGSSSGNSNNNQNSGKTKKTPDLVVDSVDAGISSGIRTAETNNEYLYIDGYDIYLGGSDKEQKYIAESAKENEELIKFISFNSDYIFYYVEKSGLYKIDRKDSSETKIEESLDPIGINTYDNNVYVYDSNKKVFEVGSGSAVEMLDGTQESSETEKYVYDHEECQFNVYINDKNVSVESGHEPKCLSDKTWLDGANAIFTPARTSVDGNDIYMVIQSSYNNVLYPHLYKQGMNTFESEAFVKYDSETKDSEILYLISNEKTDEQIVGFSAKNSKLYICSGHELFVSDLDGNNRTKICDVPESDKLFFEYVNDKILIYNSENELLGGY